MPIYEFQCAPCGHRFEELIRNDADAQALTCPECSGQELEKLLSAFAVGGNAAPACPGQVQGCSDGTSGACGGRPGFCAD